MSEMESKYCLEERVAWLVVTGQTMKRSGQCTCISSSWDE